MAYQGIPLPHLRAWRKRACFSQTLLADLAGVSRYTVMNLEIDRYHGAQYYTIKALAQALDISPQQLIETPPPGGSPARVTRNAPVS